MKPLRIHHEAVARAMVTPLETDLGTLVSELVRAGDARALVLDVARAAVDIADHALDKLDAPTTEDRARVAILRRILIKLSP